MRNFSGYLPTFLILLSVSASAGEKQIPIRWTEGLMVSQASASDIVVIDSRQTLEIKQAYQDLARDYEMRQAHGMMSNADVRAEYAAKMAAFATDVSGKIRNYHIQQNRGRLVEAMKESETMRPALYAATVGAACTGSPIQVRVNKDLEIISKTDFANQKGDFQFNSNVLNGNVYISGQAPVNNVDPTIRDERVKLSVNRAIPQTDMVSAITFGSTTNSLTASISKPLAAGLNAEVGASQALGANLSHSDQVVKVNYQVRF
jgi:hypothetical protein